MYYLQGRVASSFEEDDRAALRERARRSVNNVTQLRDLLQELLDSDPEFAQMLQGPPVSE